MTELTRIETVVFLQRVGLFSACSAEQILRISAIVKQREFESGQTIYRAQDPSERMYCVVDGAVLLKGADAASAKLESPESFGVKEILSGRLREQDAVAAQDLRVLTIDADDLFDLLANNIEIVKALFRRLLESPEFRLPVAESP